MSLSAESIALNVSSVKSQMLTTLLESTGQTGTAFADILAGLQSSSGSTAASTGGGDGYALLNRIDELATTFKAQYAELSHMEEALPALKKAGDKLNAAAQAGSGDLAAQVQAFADQYNAWVQRFGPDVQSGGVLAGVQAAEVSVYELNQAITDRFLGAEEGYNGLADLGIAIDPDTKQMTVDKTKLDAALARDPLGSQETLADFGAHFSQAAGLLAADNNIVRHRLDNLNSAIGYIDANSSAWQQEFGGGSSNVASALNAYNTTSGL